MNRLFLSLILAITCLAAKSQIAYWELHPIYGSVKIMSNGDYLVSQNGKYGIIGSNEKEILPAQYDSIGDFKNGSALVFKKDKNRLVGFVNENGEMTTIEDQFRLIDIKNAHFSDGYLPVWSTIKKEYYYISQKNGESYGPYNCVNPFKEGYASVITNSAKDRNTYSIIKAEDMSNVSFGQNIDPGDINFTSTPNNGKAIVVIKKQFFEYDLNNGQLRPLTIDGTFEKHSLVTADSKNIMAQKTDDGFRISAKNAVFNFDNIMRLFSSKYQGQVEKKTNIQLEKEDSPSSEISKYSDNGGILVGLLYKGDRLLPQQFEDIIQTVGNKAVVKQKGKYGVIKIDSNSTFSFKLNDNKSIAFEHGYCNSSLLVTFPPYINPSTAKVESYTKECELKAETRKDNQNVETSSIMYDCQITMNDDITEDVQPVIYKFSIAYDGLYSKIYTISLNERYIKAYDVSITAECFKDNIADIDFEVKSLNADGNYYEKVVKVKPEREEQVVVLEKNNENSYHAKIYGLNDNNVVFDIIVTEDGCPSVIYQFMETIPVVSEKNPIKPTVKKSGRVGKVTKKNSKPEQDKSKQDKPIFIPQ